MKEEKSLSRWLDDLEPEDMKAIEQFSLPWQKKFLCRFYKQLKKQKISKSEVTERVNKNTDDSLLPADYTLPRNTLTQFTNFNSVNMRVVSVTNLIAVSLALGVSLNYLLGIDELETPENTDINKATGLPSETIEAIKNNENLQEKLNFFLLCPEIKGICEEIDRLFFTRLVSNDLLHPYSKELLGKMERAYNQSFKESFSLDEEKEKKEKYKECLYRELPFEKLKSGGTQNSIQEYLESNLTEERIVQIQFLGDDDSSCDEQDVYHAFIEMITEHTFDVFEKRYIGEMQMGNIIKSVTILIDEYIEFRTRKFHKQARTASK